VQERRHGIVAGLLEVLGFLAIDEVYELRSSRNDDIVPGILDLRDLVYAEILTPLTAKLISWNVRWGPYASQPPSVCPVRDRQEHRRLLSHAYELYSMKACSSRFQVSVDRLKITSSNSTYSLLKGRPSLSLLIQLYLSTVYKRSCNIFGARRGILPRTTMIKTFTSDESSCRRTLTLIPHMSPCNNHHRLLNLYLFVEQPS